MKFIRTSLFFLAILNPIHIYAVGLKGKTFLPVRSQSTHADRELVGWHQFINQNDRGLYGAFAASTNYTRSFRAERIAGYFFGTNHLLVSGSGVTTRTDQHILADYFGLSPSFESKVKVIPRLQNWQFNFNWYGGYENWYLRAYMPLVWAKHGIFLEEDIANDGTDTPYPALYMQRNALAAPYTSFAQAMQGGQSFGNVQPLEFGKMCCNMDSIFDVAEAHIVAGYNFVATENGHAGLNVRLGIPGGTRSTANYLFEPVVGNGHHWEFGFGFSGDVILWEKDGYQRFDLLVDINATHLFKSCQRRSFDLKCANDFGSRYILAKEFDAAGNYTGTSFPLINKTTLNCKSRFAVQFDILIGISYKHGDWLFDFGYDGWLRSREKISCLDPFPENTYALKGIQNTDLLIVGKSNATQSTATIHGNLFTDQAALVDNLPPVFVRESDLDIDSAEAHRAFTHTFYWNINKTWDRNDYCNYVNPFFGFGGSVEFESVRYPDFYTDDYLANKPSIAQWSVWVKGGFGY